MSIASLLEPITGESGPVKLASAGSWMQGRTLYGGASTLLAYTHATKSFPDLPPLRAAQIGFVAPIGEEVELTAEIVRQGRNVAQLRSEIHCESKLALTTFLLFGAARDANAIHPAAPVDDWPGAPDQSEAINTEKFPDFIRNNFELRRGQDDRGPGSPVVRRWFRLKDRDTLDSVSAMLLLGDTNPPGAIRAMKRQGPISSINWSLNVLDPAPQTDDGWWFGENRSEHADVGYSSERLAMWNTKGEQVMSGLQSVAVFG